jgi:hypothetical protein
VAAEKISFGKISLPNDHPIAIQSFSSPTFLYLRSPFLVEQGACLYLLTFIPFPPIPAFFLPVPSSPGLLYRFSPVESVARFSQFYQLLFRLWKLCPPWQFKLH